MMDDFSLFREKLAPYSKYSICMAHDITKWDLLTAGRRLEYFSRGKTICNQGDSGYLFIFNKGVGIVSKVKPNGNQITFYYDLPGSIFGFDSMTSGEPYKTSLTAVENCSVFRVPATEFTHLYNTNHSLMCEVIDYEKKRSFQNLTHMEMLMFDGVETRLSLLLLGMAYKCGIYSTSGIKIPIHITHQQLSDLINANRVSVSRVLSPLIKDKVLEKNYGYLCILKPNCLLSMADDSF